MKRILKVVSGFAAVMTLGCLLTASAQARTFVSVNIGGFGGSVGYSNYGGGGRAYCAPAPVCAPVYAPAPVCVAAPVCAPAPVYYPPAGYCYRAAPVYYRPACGYYSAGPACYYGRSYCR